MRWARFCVAVFAFGAVASLASCARPADESLPAAGSAVAVDPTLLAFLSRARSAHHRADLNEEAHPEAATRALLDLVDGPFPEGGTTLPEVREVLADTHARLADLKSRSGKYEAANRHIDQGLELAQKISYLRGHLFEMRGLVAERFAEAKKREAEQLLETADKHLVGPGAAELESVQTRIGTLREQLNQDPNAGVRQDLAAAERALAALRLASLPPDRREVHRALVGERDAAITRALDAFEASMEIQAQVIETRTHPASGPTPESSGVTPR